MASDSESRTPQLRRKRIPLGGSRRRLSFERQLRLWLHLMVLPTAVLSAVLMRNESLQVLVAVLLCEIAVWALIVSVLMEMIVRPLQTLTNVIGGATLDNFYLDHLLSEGVIGLGLILLVVFSPLAIRNAKWRGNRNLALWGVACVAVVVSLTGNVLVNPLYGAVTMIIMWGTVSSPSAPLV